MADANDSLYTRLGGYDAATLAHFNVPEREQGEVAAFVESTKIDIVEC
jgi:hypothetical protein